MDLEDILIAVILDCKPKFYFVEREDFGYGPFVEPNGAVALDSGVLVNMVYAGVAVDVDVDSTGMADVYYEVWFAVDQDQSGRHCLAINLLN